MAIKDVGQMSQLLKTYDANSWTGKINKSREFGFPKGVEGLDQAMPDGVDEAGSSKTFGDFLVDSISKVNNLQHEANTAVQELASGKTKNVAETLLTVEKAELAFKTMNQVRQKVIDAYREIMRMQL